MLKRMVNGALAGTIATGPQSAVVWGLRRAGVYGREAPPEAVGEGVTDRVVGLERVPDRWMPAITAAQHVGFGAAGGAAYGAITTVVPPSPLTGALTGLAIWFGSYRGWIPSAKIMPPAERDEEGRQLALILAHVAYGLTLGETMRRLMRDV